MGKVRRFAMFVAGLTALLAAVSATATATTWTNAGATAFTATSGAFTMTAGGVATQCTGARMTGTAPASSAGPNYVITGVTNPTGCTLLGQNQAVACNFTLTGTVYNAGSGSFSGMVTLSCTQTPSGCRITGTVPGTYTLPNLFGLIPARLSINGTSGLSSSGCIMTGAISLTPNPWVFTVQNGTGGTNPTLGPAPRQP